MPSTRLPSIFGDPIPPNHRYRHANMNRALLDRFVDSFQKAVDVEMEAMRKRMGPFEAPLAHPRVLDSDNDGPGQHYQFRVLQPNDKLVLQAECTLMASAQETLVTITGMDGDEIVLQCDRQLDLSAESYTLVIYPWFLYEKLKTALHSLLDSERYNVDTALALFGQAPPQDTRSSHTAPSHSPNLNASQNRAVVLCCQRSPAFVWGPPGTGKTTTLGHIVTALLGQGLRILVTSTTNAAVDQALARLAALDSAQEPLEQGQILRIGQTRAETFGASLQQVVRRLNARTQALLTRASQRALDLAAQIGQCRKIVEQLSASSEPVQLRFFEEVAPSSLTPRDLSTVFSTHRVPALLALPIDQQQELLTRRLMRLEICLDLNRERVARSTRQLRGQEGSAVQGARVILATMTNVYISGLLQRERFDVVIVEEAGMAILPTLFYCAALGTRAIMVGDPQQLPPIVQSSEAFVYRAMGRSIFEVTVPDAEASDLVVMLDTQYRMHPVIGDLVSELFYHGKLRHDDIALETGDIAAKEPYPGAPLVVLDTAGRSVCATREGGYSRLNEKTAQVCADLAVEAVRDGLESVAIITPYVEQSRLIRRLLPTSAGLAQHVECRTVHRFQGGERDMVILDTVDAAPLRPGTLLAGNSPGASPGNLINVSISRARGKLIIVADVAYFSRHVSAGIINSMLRRALQTGLRASISDPACDCSPPP